MGLHIMSDSLGVHPERQVEQKVLFVQSLRQL